MSTIQEGFRFVPIAVLAAILGLAGSAGAQTEADSQNVWVHYDYMVFPKGWTSLAGVTYPDGLSMAPPKEAIDQVVEAFRAQGLTLHIDPIHNAIPGHQVVIPDFDPWWTSPSAACVGRDAISFMTLKNQYFQPHDNHPWHYAIFAFNIGTPDTTSPNFEPCPPDPLNGRPIDPSSPGLSELPGFNFILANGTFMDDLGIGFVPVNFVGSSFMHELGHNFGLMHGGVIPCGTGQWPCFRFGDGELSLESGAAFKPNYISVMSYSDYNNGILEAAQPGSGALAQCHVDKDCPGGSHCAIADGNVCYRLDYSSQALPTLNELHLDETVGVGGPPGDMDIVWYCNAARFCGQTGPSFGPIDWNGDGLIETSAMADIDWDQLGTPTIPFATLDGFDDWTYVKQQLQIPPQQIESGPKRIVHETAPRKMPFAPR